MSAFEFVFSLFGLLLGLCVAEVLGGLGRALESREKVLIGWLTPMLGGFILLDLISYWFHLWVDRENIPMTPLTLVVGTAIAGAYYLAAYLIFPDDLRRYADLDAHYMRIRRTVLGIALAAFTIQLGTQSIVTSNISLGRATLSLAILAPFYLVAMLAKRKAVAGSALAVIIILNLIAATMMTLSTTRIE